MKTLTCAVTVALVLGATLFGCCSCATQRNHTPSITGAVDKLRKQEAERKTLAGCNTDLTDCGSLSTDQAATANKDVAHLFPGEAAYYSPNRPDDWPSDLPQLCIAMSGGGLRSAATNIGALQGLDDLGLLSKVDIMSSVSGGSYANYWYHAHKLSKWRSPGDVTGFLKEGSVAEQEIDSGHFLNVFGALVLAAPLDWIINRISSVFQVILGHNEVTSASSSFYADHLQNYFYYDRSLLYGQGVPTWSDYLSTSPFFIINATVATSRCPKPNELDAVQNSFEFTPLGRGSRTFRVQPNTNSLPLENAVAISGAASDTPGKYCRAIAWLVNLPLGGTILSGEASEPKKAGEGFVRRVLTTIMFGPRGNEPQAGEKWVLSDGGAVDNTGALPLVTRLCRRIIVVDASLKPTASDAKCRADIERRGSGVEPPSCAFEQVATWAADDLAPAALKGETPKAPFKRLLLGAFPYPNAKPLALTIDYLRLYLDANIRAGVLNELRHLQQEAKAPNANYYDDAIAFLLREPPNHQFPWASIWRQSFSRGEFQAYKALGRYLVHQYIGRD